jgi:predicted metal-binding protein
MVNNTISLNENASRILNNIKEMYGLETDSEAIEFMACQCIEEPELRPEYIEKMKEIDKEESIHVPHGMGLLEYLDSLPDDDEDDLRI